MISFYSFGLTYLAFFFFQTTLLPGGEIEEEKRLKKRKEKKTLCVFTGISYSPLSHCFNGFSEGFPTAVFGFQLSVNLLSPTPRSLD